jgi:hypothetical protein
MNYGSLESLPSSRLLCPKCGIGVFNEIMHHFYGKHRYCIANGIRNNEYKDYDSWLLACKANYESLVTFFQMPNGIK